MPEGAATPQRLDELTEQAKQAGAAGLAWFRVADADRRLDGPLARHLSEPETGGVLERTRQPAPATSSWPSRTSTARPARCWACCASTLGSPPVGQGPHRYVWVVDFPMFDGVGADGHPQAAHHPFTMPYPEDLPQLATDPFRCVPRPTTSSSTGGSSARAACVSTAATSSPRCSPPSASAPRRPRPASASCSAPSATAPAPRRLRRRASTAWPPMLAGEENIREVIAYPKTQSGSDPLTGAPPHCPRPAWPSSASGSSSRRPRRANPDRAAASPSPS